MSQQNKEQQEEDTLSFVSSNISNDFILIGQSANEDGEQDVNVNVGHTNPQPNLPLSAIGTTDITYLKLQNDALEVF
jgi:hypothetical protein